MFSRRVNDAAPRACVRGGLEEHPELGRGLDVALEHGCAVRDVLTGRWAPSASGDFLYGEVLEAREKLGRAALLELRDE